MANFWEKILRDNRFQAADVPNFTNKLFFEGPRQRAYLERFFTLLILAAIIATSGILADSTATVIGAMIVAPLMTPIMALATALVMGNAPRALKSMLLVMLGVTTVILLGWLFGLSYQGIIQFDENSQILGRTTPKFIDLIAALAAGAAGAFCLSREDIADSLPGVAISISLVPPLCVVGLCLSGGQWEAAAGALLLFVTNFLSILLAGGGVLVLLGLNSAALNRVRGTGRRNAYALVIITTLIVAVPLVLTGRQLTGQILLERQTRTAALAWTEDTGYRVRLVRTTVNNNQVEITISGQGEPPLFEDLVTAVHEAVGQPVDVYLEIVPVQGFTTVRATP